MIKDLKSKNKYSQTPRFNTAASTYNHFSSMQQLVFNQLFNRIQHCSFQSILDIGCGTGLGTRKLHTHFNSNTTLGIDKSSSMINVANKQHNQPNLIFRVQDANMLTESNCNDLIFSSSALHWILDLNYFFNLLSSIISNKTSLAFAICLPQTFHELSKGIQLLFNPNHQIPTHTFLDYATLHSLLRQFWPTCNISTFTTTLTFKDIKQLFLTMKNTGVTTSSSIFWTPRKLNQLEQWFTKEYQTIQLTVSYLLMTSLTKKQL